MNNAVTFNALIYNLFKYQYFNLSFWFRSISDYLRSLKLGPNNAVMHVNLAIIYHEQG